MGYNWPVVAPLAPDITSKPGVSKVTVPLRFAQPTAGFRPHEVPTFEHHLSNDTSDLDPLRDARQVLRTAITRSVRGRPSYDHTPHPLGSS
jgi:hypothetical protein